MCGSPKPPPLPPPDPEVERQKEEARQRSIDEKRREKDARTEAASVRASGGMGVRSLITGPKGGQGYARSLIG